MDNQLLLLRVLLALIDDERDQLAKELAGQMDRDDAGLVPAVANWVVDPLDPIRDDPTIQSLVTESLLWLQQHPTPGAAPRSPSGGYSAS